MFKSLLNSHFNQLYYSLRLSTLFSDPSKQDFEEALESGFEFNSEHLNTAIIKGFTNEALKILGTNISVSPRNFDLALRHNHEEIAGKLIYSDDKLDPEYLKIAIFYGKTDFVFHLIERGINLTNDHFESAILWKKNELLHQIIDSGIKLSADHLFTSIAYRDYSLADKIFKTGIKLEKKQFDKVTQRDLDFELSAKMIEYGVIPTSQDFDNLIHCSYPFNPYHDQTNHEHCENNIDSLEKLSIKIINSGVTPNKDHLYSAIKLGLKDLSLEIMKKGVEFDCAHYKNAVSNNHYELIEFMESSIHQTFDPNAC